MTLDAYLERILRRRPKTPEKALPLRVRIIGGLVDRHDRSYAAREDAAGQHEERLAADAARKQQRYDEWIESWKRGGT